MPCRGEDMSCECAWRAPRDSSNGMWRFTSLESGTSPQLGTSGTVSARRLGRGADCGGGEQKRRRRRRRKTKA